MPAKTKEDKKRDIFEYIQKESSNNENYLTLERSKIINQFSDKYYNSEQIEEILNELVENEPVNSGDFKLELIYPENDEERIEEKLTLLNKHSLVIIFIAGFYNYLIFLQATDGMNSFLEGAGDIDILMASVFATGVAYVSGKFTIWLSNLVSEKVTIVREHKHLVGATVILWAFGGLAMWIYSLERSVPPIVITYVPASIAAAVAYAKYIKGEQA
jgi:hypothetical protein